VIGFDDIASAAFQIPRLTTVAQPLRLMGETGAQTLLKRLQKPYDAFPDAIVFEPQFIRRESTGPVPRLRRSNRVSH
jgi:DNA-binding LacI/PurR family transcriptional regulator